MLKSPVSHLRSNSYRERRNKKKMHLSENEGVEGNTFVVTGGLGYVGAALCLELVRRGARQVRSFDLRNSSPWSDDLRNSGVRCIQGFTLLSHQLIPLRSVWSSYRSLDLIDLWILNRWRNSETRCRQGARRSRLRSAPRFLRHVRQRDATVRSLRRGQHKRDM